MYASRRTTVKRISADATSIRTTLRCSTQSPTPALNAPVVKTGVPSRVPWVRIQSLRAHKCRKRSVFLQNPRVSLGVLCVCGPHFWLHGFALCRANPRKPYGTIGDTSAQLTAPFSGVFRHPADLRNRWITRAQRPPHQQIPSRRYRQSGAASYVRQKHDSCVIMSMHRHRLPATCRSQPVWKHRKGQSSSVDGGGSPS